MAGPDEVISRMMEVPLGEVTPGALDSAEVCRAAILIPLFAFAARRAELVGVQWTDPRAATVVEVGRSAIVAGAWENRTVFTGIIDAFQGFRFAAHRGWLESQPAVRAALCLDLGVPDGKRRQFWRAVDDVFSETRSRLLDGGQLQHVLSVDVYGAGGIDADWALLSPFNWTKFASDATTITGGLTVAAAGMSSSAILLVPAGVLLICGACLKQLAE